MARRLVIFNHKGGVSKTTTAYNLGWMISKKHRVLLVDADPQCNLSSLLLRDDFEKYYIDEETKKQNIKDGVSVAFEGRPYPIHAAECFSPERSKNLYLLAGHANLSEYDAALTFAQTSNNALATLQNLPGAFNELIKLTEEKYDIEYTIVDLNPGLSAINQNLFLTCDLFIIPTNPDPFSIMAIDTLGKIIPRWSQWKTGSFDVFSETAYPLRPGLPRFGGGIIQRFNIRNGKAARPYRDNIEEIKNCLINDLIPALNKTGMMLPDEYYPKALHDNKFCLGEVPDFGGLLPKSHNCGVPVFELTDVEIAETGQVLDGMKEKRDRLNNQFSEIANDIVALLNYE
jgi:chromosome partitioning protein